MSYKKQLIELNEENEALEHEINSLNQEILKLKTQLIWNRMPFNNTQVELEYLNKIMGLNYNLNNIPIFIPHEEFINSKLSILENDIENLFQLTGVKFEDVKKEVNGQNTEFKLSGNISNCIQFESTFTLSENIVKNFKITTKGGVYSEFEESLKQNQSENNVLDTFIILTKYCDYHTKRVEYFNRLRLNYSQFLSSNTVLSNLFQNYQTNLPIKTSHGMNNNILHLECPKTKIGLTIDYNLLIKSNFEVLKSVKIYPCLSKEWYQNDLQRSSIIKSIPSEFQKLLKLYSDEYQPTVLILESIFNEDL
ncbi:hypothetical protein CONCODRAFT_82636 [Conidiobolus coronatus NRRL 28638]|uniref:Uncharacterized protein n=1 Tax=Conidiobolus coronatus (strain ATCC 28846 / CBS 209.66 / NRRL 28638) TaxID=796925 RepID=A0A137PIU9_CONC2|nr:hypothetical protein CONCODRAFT_82636 [Conidiobolus coronatus NRRL 28638]|eukprot:KXN74861.1 hypothetical protein CONCODRAFT_82636 [Conidiobolus coronatus NRRL 28638]